MTLSSKLGAAAFAGFIATIWAANWLIETYGIVPVGFGLMAPAGVFAVGVAFTLRDIAQRTHGDEDANDALIAEWPFGQPAPLTLETAA